MTAIYRENEIRIYRHDEIMGAEWIFYEVSQKNVPLPGLYATEGAAEYACSVNTHSLYALCIARMDEVEHTGIYRLITIDDLKLLSQ